MKILLLGGSGQLGSDIIKLSRSFEDFILLSPSSKDLDITNFESLSLYINTHLPNIIINCAAYTNVDGAEKDKKKAEELNFNAVKNINKIVKRREIFFIQISTDYVFGGKGKGPYQELDTTSPMTFYGLTKLKAEKFIQSNFREFIIIRTASLIGLEGKNFFKTVINNLKSKKQMQIISDQKISVSWSKELAMAIISICRKYKINQMSSLNKIVHIVNKGFTSWYDLGKEIEYYFHEFSNNTDFDSIITEISHKDWASETNRPKDSRLCINENFYSDTDIVMNEWKKAVKLITLEFMRINND